MDAVNPILCFRHLLAMADPYSSGGKDLSGGGGGFFNINEEALQTVILPYIREKDKREPCPTALEHTEGFMKSAWPEVYGENPYNQFDRYYPPLAEMIAEGRGLVSMFIGRFYVKMCGKNRVVIKTDSITL